MLTSNGHGASVQASLSSLGSTMAASKASTSSFASAPVGAPDIDDEEDDGVAAPMPQMDADFTFSLATVTKTTESPMATDGYNSDEDSSFDGHESNDDDDDDEVEVVATGRVHKKSSSSVKRTKAEDDAAKKRQLKEMAQRLGVNINMDDSDDEEGHEEIDLSDTDGEDSDDDDDDDSDNDSYDFTERPEDREGIVRSNLDRVRDALGQKRMTVATASASARLSEAMANKNYDHLPPEQQAAARRRDLAKESERTLMQTFAEAGLPVNAPDPIENGDGVDVDEDVDTPEPPACTLAPVVVSQVQTDEPALAEALAEASRLIMGGVLVGYTKGAPMSTDLGGELPKVWGESSTTCRFYLSWRQTVDHLVARTKARQCGAFFATYATAMKSPQAYELEVVDHTINPALMTEDNAAFACSQCADLVPPRAKPDSMVRTVQALRFVFHRSNQVAGKSARVLSASGGVPPSNSALAKMFVTCDRCVPLVHVLNMMLMAPFLLAAAAQAFLLERQDSGQREVLEAFTTWQPRIELCTAIASSYKLLHAVALD